MAYPDVGASQRNAAIVADFLQQTHDSAASQKRRLPQNFAAAALKTAARFWFLVAVIGQLAFVLYIVAVYGRSAARGDFEAWNKFVPHGHIPGDTVGNFAFAMHILLAVVIIVSGAIQLIPQIRDRAPSFHRWIGRIYVLTAFAISIGGLYLVWIRESVGDFGQHAAVSLNAVLIMLCAAMALRYALARKFAAHRRWALRLFLVASGVWFFRVGFMLWVFLVGPVGFDQETFQGPFTTLWTFGQCLLPLAVLELYLRARDRAGASGRIAVAAGLFALTVAMGLGIFLATVGMWLPRI